MYSTSNIHLIISRKRTENKFSRLFAFQKNICTFALPLLGMECLIKINYCERIKLQNSIDKQSNRIQRMDCGRR